ncbi:hypothetical protein PV762_17200 [Mitsuaria sp. CC2]|jgi:hypothetical protein|uniref:hypothetical protein n=1 Tax=Mitsuaria sp. CC2 TaxID=3029186 RepID=UPI003B8BB138
MSAVTFRIEPTGNLGNQMMQLMLGHTLRSKIPELEIVGHDMPLWGLKGGEAPAPRGKPVELRGHLIDIHAIASLVKAGLMRDMTLEGIGSRMANYLPPSAYQSLFPAGQAEVEHHGADELLISVRGAEILGQCHPDYGPVPPAYYRQLARETGLRPVLFGQIEDDWYSRLLMEAMPDARVVRSHGVLADFERLRSARHVVTSVSSFAWLATWFSNAETIHVPVLGLLNPAQRPDVDLLPLDDPRYRFYRFPIRHWNGQQEDVDGLSREQHYPLMSRDEVAAMLRQADAATRGQRLELGAKTLVKGVLGRLRG